MISSNRVERSSKLGSMSSKDIDDLVLVDSIAKNLYIFCDYIPGFNRGLNFYVIRFSEDSRYPKVVMELGMLKARSIHKKPTYSVVYVSVDDMYKGFNLAPIVYAHLLRKFDGWILKSGSSQSIGGKSLWNSLCRISDISVYAYDAKNEDIHKCKYTENGVLDCEVDVYNSRSKYHLYATKTYAKKI